MEGEERASELTDGIGDMHQLLQYIDGLCVLVQLQRERRERRERERVGAAGRQTERERGPYPPVDEGLVEQQHCLVAHIHLQTTPLSLPVKLAEKTTGDAHVSANDVTPGPLGYGGSS